MAKAKPPKNLIVQRPSNVGALLSQAVKFMQGGMAWQAKAQCQQVLQMAPGNADAHYFLGLIAARSEQFEEAARHIAESLKFKPANPAAHNNLGVVLKKLRRVEEAVASFEAAVQQKADYVEAHHNLANSLRVLSRFDEALASFDNAIGLRPDFAEGFNGRGNVLVDLKRHDDALASFDRAIALRPDYAEAFSNKANALLALELPHEALLQAEKAVALKKDNGEAHNNRGAAFVKLKRFDEALPCFAQAIALNPKDAVAYANRGGALMEMKRYEEAINDLDQAIALDLDYADAYNNRAQAATGAKRHAEAASFYQRLFALDPSYPFVKGNLLHARMLCSDWTDFATLSAAIQADLQAGLPVAEPFGYQGIAESESALLACAKVFSSMEFPAAGPIARMAESATSREDERITIGYLCGEFRQHATSILMCGVYEHHDKSRFRLIALDNGEPDASDYRQRINAAFDEVIDISRLSDIETAHLIQRENVDILVNLNGYFGNERTAVFAMRPSPLQVNYLGFPGTMGAAYFDYLIADEVVIPLASQAAYSEKIAYLPNCYQANDAKRAVADRAFTRAEFGLPADAVVFCCFNNNYKILPSTFDAWMRILSQVEDSCLWLLENNAAVAANLRQAAEARGVAASRLVFATHMPVDEHLARHALADLFLDTLPYNAHTTASDALWAGLPVLARTGTTFPGRVTTSLLQALDLPELIVDSEQAYEDMAVRLAKNAAELAAIKAKLTAHRHSKPLFDTPLFTRHLEAAYAMMVERHRAGLPPEHLYVES